MILPGLRDLVGGLERHPAFQDLVPILGRAEPQKLRLSGLNATGLALYATLLHIRTERPVALVVGSSAIAEVLAETAGAFFELLEVSTDRVAPFVLPAHDVTPYDGLSPHAEISEKRGIGLWRMADRRASLVVAPVASALLRTASADFLRNFCWKIEVGGRVRSGGSGGGARGGRFRPSRAGRDGRPVFASRRDHRRLFPAGVLPGQAGNVRRSSRIDSPLRPEHAEVGPEHRTNAHPSAHGIPALS